MPDKYLNFLLLAMLIAMIGFAGHAFFNAVVSSDTSRVALSIGSDLKRTDVLSANGRRLYQPVTS